MRCLLLCSLTLSAAAAWSSDYCPPGLICAPLPGDNPEARLCVISSPEAGAEWFVFGEGSLPRKLLKVPETSLLQITQLDVSPRYLAVMSVGEGHPMLDVLDLPALLEDRESAVAYSLNPYPHLVDSAGWLAEDRLALEVTRLLDDSPLPEGVPDCSGGHYALELPAARLDCRAHGK